MAEKFLSRCWHDGPHPTSKGRQRSHEPDLYTMIRRQRTMASPMPYADIAAVARYRFPTEAAITKDAVARIWPG